MSWNWRTNELAKIASATRDPETGRQLMEVVKRIFEAVGLSSENE